VQVSAYREALTTTLEHFILFEKKRLIQRRRNCFSSRAKLQELMRDVKAVCDKTVALVVRDS
jgi:hypothetical protein